MYLDFFGLTEYPFNITPDPRFLCFTKQHRDAYQHLLYGIESRKGFIELTGEVGCGKTTLCRLLLSELRQRDICSALVLNPSLSETQLLRAILTDFGIVTSSRDRLTCIERLNDFLLENNQMGRNVALLIDEAQKLTPQVMEQVRLLSNLETESQKLMQIVLCGQPELKERLAHPDMRQLRQRITVRYHLRLLTRAETRAYIRHRLTVAGGAGINFDNHAMDAVFTYTGGVPRMINALCDNVMLAGYVMDTQVINNECVRRAVRQLEGIS